MTAADICGGFTIKLGEIDMSRGDSLLLIDEGSPMSVVTSDLRSYLGACLRQIQRRKFVLIAILILIYLYATVWRPESQQWRRRPPSYNSVYPLTPPKRHKDGMVTFAITIVADMDLDSSVGDKGYRSWMHKGFLNISSTILKAASNSESFTSLLNGENCVVSVVLDSPSPSALMSGFGYKNRGAELSDLAVFNGKLYTCDDRTGIVFELVSTRDDAALLPKVILVDGSGLNETKGFKCEWMTVKDGKLYIGGLGKEWTTGNGEYVNDNPMFVKTIDHQGIVEHLNWKEKYGKIRAKLGFQYPGYMVFEAVGFSDLKQKWYFLPRRTSSERYDELADRQRGSNLMIEADLNFKNIRSIAIGSHDPARGFSSFKFIPETNDNLIIALRTEEIDDTHMKTYYTLFNVHGELLVPETVLSNSIKYEGIEFT